MASENIFHCDFCDSVTTVKSHLKRHQKSVHRRLGPNYHNAVQKPVNKICFQQDCGRVLTSNNLAYHKQLMHRKTTDELNDGVTIDTQTFLDVPEYSGDYEKFRKYLESQNVNCERSNYMTMFQSWQSFKEEKALLTSDNIMESFEFFTDFVEQLPSVRKQKMAMQVRKHAADFLNKVHNVSVEIFNPSLELFVEDYFESQMRQEIYSSATFDALEGDVQSIRKFTASELFLVTKNLEFVKNLKNEHLKNHDTQLAMIPAPLQGLLQKYCKVFRSAFVTSPDDERVFSLGTKFAKGKENFSKDIIEWIQENSKCLYQLNIEKLVGCNYTFRI